MVGGFSSIPRRLASRPCQANGAGSWSANTAMPKAVRGRGYRAGLHRGGDITTGWTMPSVRRPGPSCRKRLMQKSKLRPIQCDAPDGRWTVARCRSLDARQATRDTSFTLPDGDGRPCYARAHASAYTGTFWVNQRTIARDLEMSQQAVPAFQKLVELGYLEKVRNENSKRPYGKKGAVRRVIYDPTQSLKDVGCPARPTRPRKKNNRPPQAPSRPPKGQRTASKQRRRT